MIEAMDPHLSRLITLCIALIGCVVTAVPLLVSDGADRVPLTLSGTGIVVTALALFLYNAL